MPSPFKISRYATARNDRGAMHTSALEGGDLRGLEPSLYFFSPPIEILSPPSAPPFQKFITTVHVIQGWEKSIVIDIRLRYSLHFVHRMHWSLYFFE